MEWEKRLPDQRRVFHVALSALLSMGPVYPDDRTINESVILWLVDLERTGIRALRWLLAFSLDRGPTFRIVVNQVYAHSGDPATQKLLVDAICDQFVAFQQADEDSPHSGVMAHLHAFIQAHSLLEARVKEAEQRPITEDDRVWQRTVEERCGVLWNLALFGMENPLAAVRQRCLDLLDRIVPWTRAPKAGKDADERFAASALLPLLAECKKRLNHKIPESAHQVAVQLSSAMAKQHVVFSEEVRRARALPLPLL